MSVFSAALHLESMNGPSRARLPFTRSVKGEEAVDSGIGHACGFAPLRSRLGLSIDSGMTEL